MTDTAAANYHLFLPASGIEPLLPVWIALAKKKQIYSVIDLDTPVSYRSQHYYVKSIGLEMDLS